MRVLLTRAEADAQRTRTALQARGHSIVVSPLIVMRALGGSWPPSVIDAVVATSAQAFDMLVGEAGPVMEARRLLPLWLVGQRTLEAARRGGFEGAAIVAPDAAALASRTEDAKAKRVVYLAGRDRKKDLEEALANRRVQVRVVEVYEATAEPQLTSAARQALQCGEIDAVLHFSRRSAMLFVVATADIALSANILHVCISHDASTPMADGDAHAVVAESPDQDGLFAAMEKWAATRR